MTDKHIPASKLLALPKFITFIEEDGSTGFESFESGTWIRADDLRALIDEAPEVESVCTLLAKDGFVWSTLWRVPIPDGKHFLYLSPPPSPDLTKLVGELVEALDSIGQRFVSGNDVPVSRATIPAEEWKSIDALLTRAKEYLK